MHLCYIMEYLSSHLILKVYNAFYNLNLCRPCKLIYPTLLLTNAGCKLCDLNQSVHHLVVIPNFREIKASNKIREQLIYFLKF